MSLKKAYIFLIFAVLTEVLATSCMKAGEELGSRAFGFLCMYVLLVASYYFMAVSLKRLSISVAYAIWEVLGVVCVVCIGVFYFGENLAWQEKLGIMLSICGIGLINYAELKGHKDTSLKSSSESSPDSENTQSSSNT